LAGALLAVGRLLLTVGLTLARALRVLRLTLARALRVLRLPLPLTRTLRVLRLALPLARTLVRRLARLRQLIGRVLGPSPWLLRLRDQGWLVHRRLGRLLLLLKHRSIGLLIIVFLLGGLDALGLEVCLLCGLGGFTSGLLGGGRCSRGRGLGCGNRDYWRRCLFAVALRAASDDAGADALLGHGAPALGLDRAAKTCLVLDLEGGHVVLDRHTQGHRSGDEILVGHVQLFCQLVNSLVRAHSPSVRLAGAAARF